MKHKIKIKGAAWLYLDWPIVLTLLLVCLNLILLTVSKPAAGITAIFVVIYAVTVSVLYYAKRPLLLNEIVRMSKSVNTVEGRLLKELAVPYAVVDKKGHIFWENAAFHSRICSKKKLLNEIIPELTKDKLPTADADTSLHVQIGDRFYEVVLRCMKQNASEAVKHADEKKDNTEEAKEVQSVSELQAAENVAKAVADSVKAVAEPKEAGKENETVEGKEGERVREGKSLVFNGIFAKKTTELLISVYFYDETDIILLKNENVDQRLVTGLLYIDNYEETFENVDEVRRSLLTALVERKINKYMVSMDAIIKKLEKDKYIFVFQHKYLDQLKASKFSLLEEVREVSIGNDSALVTISMGIGVNADSYLEGYEMAHSAIDLALGRGGDQAVVKEGNRFSYYGGANVQMEKSTRVKARVKAHALREYIEGKEKVVIMGHVIGDNDSFGSAVGIYRIAKTFNKKAYIVLGEVTSSIRPVLEKFKESADYEEDMVVSPERAKDIVDYNTLLVVVDVNRPSYTECPDLLNQTKTIVILDHHRQTAEAIANPSLSYVEPFASSACEMVAEILQYIENGLKLRSLEADAMYAGIMIDTNNFLTKTGVRTFEAAAFLRRNGADVTRIRKMFRAEAGEYHAKAKTVAGAEVFEGHFAFSVAKAEPGVESPTIVAAQAANELLNMNGIMASFVFSEFNGKVYVSARSIDEVNVQVIMEKLGGGGHMSVAGGQFADRDILSVIDMVKDVLRTMIDEGEIKLN